MPDNEKKSKDATWTQTVVPDAKTEAFAPAVLIAEIDRLALLLEETKKIAADTQQVVKLTSIGVEETKNGVFWTKIGLIATKRGIVATIVLSSVAIGLSIANILLYLKVI
jgi:hypothetical protein